MSAAVLTSPVPPPPDSYRSEMMYRLFGAIQKARFNQLYYGRRAERFQAWIKWLNIIASVAASAALAGLLNNGWGLLPWRILTGIAAISAAVGPVMGLESKVSQMEKAGMGHTIVFDRLRALLSDLKMNDVEESYIAREGEVNAFSDALSVLDEPPVDSLRKRCWSDVMEELPSDRAWDLI